MKAKLVMPYRLSLNGLQVHSLEQGMVVEGEIAKKLVKQNLAKETKAKDAVAVFNDDGFIEVEQKNVVETLEQALEVIAEQASKIAELESKVEALSKSNEQPVKQAVVDDGDDNAETDETTG